MKKELKIQSSPVFQAIANMVTIRKQNASPDLGILKVEIKAAEMIYHLPPDKVNNC